MNKLFLVALLSFIGVSAANAQGANDLFPELKGQFKPAVKTEPATTEQDGSQSAETVETKIKTPDRAAQGGTTAPQTRLDMQKQTPDEVELERGKVSLAMEQVRGTMAYARNYSYCFAEAVVRNDTTQKLENLTVLLTYGKTPTKLVFTGVDKKSQKTEKFTMVGTDCALIRGTPTIEIQTCELGALSNKSCQNRFQFIPPQ